MAKVIKQVWARRSVVLLSGDWLLSFSDIDAVAEVLCNTLVNGHMKSSRAQRGRQSEPAMLGQVGGRRNTGVGGCR